MLVQHRGICELVSFIDVPKLKDKAKVSDPGYVFSNLRFKSSWVFFVDLTFKFIRTTVEGIDCKAQTVN